MLFLRRCLLVSAGECEAGIVEVGLQIPEVVEPEGWVGDWGIRWIAGVGDGGV